MVHPASSDASSKEVQMSVVDVLVVLVVALVMAEVARPLRRHPAWAEPAMGAIAAAGVLVVILTATR